jgi:uncharacterized protein with ParB-like and HNH nuclease domain
MTPSDHDLDSLDEEHDDIRITEYDIAASSNDFNVNTIIDFIEEGAIKLPPYQRNYTWDKKGASKLIESLIIGLPVPQVFLYEEGRNSFSILDGQQRLMSVYFFCKKRFPLKNKRAELRAMFAQKGVYPETILADDSFFEAFNLELPSEEGQPPNPLNQLNFDTLDDFQRQLKLRPIRCVIIKQNEPRDDNSSVFEIFDRLNTGGVNLKPQEIRANLYYSDFYKMIYDLNSNPLWRRVIGKEELDSNLRDVELILRAFSMICYTKEYRPSMTRFLNRFSNEAKKHYDSGKISLLKNLFELFLISTENIDPSLFRLSGRFSIAVFEAAFYGCAHAAYNNSDPARMKTIDAETLGSLTTKLQPKMQEGTSKKDNVIERMRIALEVIQ